jgi:lysophospholipase L1-like esterase
MLDLARDAGFEVITLFGIYDDQDIFDIRIADWDYHPNAKGHEVIAERLFEELAKRPELFE